MRKRRNHTLITISTITISPTLNKLNNNFEVSSNVFKYNIFFIIVLHKIIFKTDE